MALMFATPCHFTSHYIAFPYMHQLALHYVGLRYVTLHSIALHNLTLRCITLHHIASHYITHMALHCITSHCISEHHISWHMQSIAANYNASSKLRCNAFDTLHTGGPKTAVELRWSHYLHQLGPLQIQSLPVDMLFWLGWVRKTQFLTQQMLSHICQPQNCRRVALEPFFAAFWAT